MRHATARQLADLCGGSIEGDADISVTGANTPDAASASDVAFTESNTCDSNAGCLVVPPPFEKENGRCLIRAANPRLSFIAILRFLYPAPEPPPGVHPSAVVASSAVVGEGCSVGTHVTVAENATIGEHCVISAGCRIGAGVRIGANTVLHPNVTLYHGVLIGERCILHAGVVVGSDGFGFAFAGDHFEKFPQVGTVEIGDDVEIGANTCIDRAALGLTRIGNGTKLDNLVHVAHNCTIGKHVVVAAQTGFSGSVTVGDYAMIGGQTGIGEKAVIDAKAVIGGKAGILTSQHVAAGEPVWGIPARPRGQHLRNLAHVARLPRTHGEIADLKKRLEKLEQRG